MAQSKPTSSSVDMLIKLYPFLDKNLDFWRHQQSGNHIIKHDSLEIVGYHEDFMIKDIDFQDTPNGIRCIMWGSLGTEGKLIPAIGEASPENCNSPVEKSYPNAMAEKRAMDRLILRLIKDKHKENLLRMDNLYSSAEATEFSQSRTDTAEEQPASRPVKKRVSPDKTALKTEIRSKRLDLGISDEGMAKLVKDLFGDTADPRTLTTSELRTLLEEVKKTENEDILEELLEESTSDSEESIDKPEEEQS